MDKIINYPDNIKERMHSIIEDELLNGDTPYNNSKCLPDIEADKFIIDNITDRFSGVVNRCKRVFGVDEINNNEIKSMVLPLLKEIIGLEKKHKVELEELAVKIIKEEFGITDEVELICELTSPIDVPTEVNDEVIIEFDDNAEMVYIDGCIKKRRFINTMINGASKKINHLFYNIDDVLTNIDYKLPDNYNKLISATDYIYFITPTLTNSLNGGEYTISYDDGKPIITVKGMIFPILINEAIKGCMETISNSGLPNKKGIYEYVNSKANIVDNQLWDLRFGPIVWDKLTNMIPKDSGKLKYQIYYEIASLSPNDFNMLMKEILLGSKKANKIIGEIISTIENEDGDMGDYFEYQELISNS
jgi:hypothetical protein